LNDWQKERQFQTLNDKKEERGVKVIRDGVERIIDVKVLFLIDMYVMWHGCNLPINPQEVVVGDIALLEPGEIVPCDGVFLSGYNVKCDESGATGESDAIKKVPYNDCLAIRQKAVETSDSKILEGGGHTDCFVVSGSKVLEGVGRYVVVAVGTKSFNGRIMMGMLSLCLDGRILIGALSSTSWRR
jgi:Ca2+-transporting ATPase